MTRVVACIAALAWVTGVAWGSEVERAIELFEQGELAEAKRGLAGVWEQGKSSAPAAYYLGRIELDAGEADAATEWFERATELAPNEGQYFLWLGHGWGTQAREASVFRQLGLAKKCRVAYERAVELDPRSADARTALVDYYLEAPGIAGGGADKAMAQAEALIALEAAAGHRLMGRVHAHGEREEEAVASYRRALEAEPDDPSTHVGLGLLYQSLEQWDDAYGAFESALAIAPGDPSALYQTGRTGALSGHRLPDARKSLLAYIALGSVGDSPGRAAAHWRLGMVYEREDDLDEAISHFEQSVALDPDFEPAQDSLKAAKKRR